MAYRSKYFSRYGEEKEILYTYAVPVCTGPTKALEQTHGIQFHHKMTVMIKKHKTATTAMIHFLVMWEPSEFLLAMSKYDSLEINTAGLSVTLEITRNFKGSWNWHLRRFQQKKNIPWKKVYLMPWYAQLQIFKKLEIRHFGNKPFNCHLLFTNLKNRFCIYKIVYNVHSKHIITLM